MRRWTGISVLAAVLLFVVSNALWAFDQPERGAPAPELVEFYTDLSTRIVVGGLGSLLSLAIFLAFASGLRSILRELEGEGLLADTAFGGTLIGLAAGLGAESINMAAALRAGDGELTESLALALFDISYVLGSYAGGIGFGVLMLALGAVALRRRALLPRWLAFVSVAIGLAMVTPLAGYALAEYTVGPCFVLLTVLGVLLLRGSAATLTPDGPP